jgi:hypothetical protein
LDLLRLGLETGNSLRPVRTASLQEEGEEEEEEQQCIS